MSWFVYNCRSCNACVIWAVSSGNKNIPVDAEPTPDGNLALEPRLGSKAPRAVEYSPLIHAKRYQAHFASCPHADRWRKERTA